MRLKGLFHKGGGPSVADDGGSQYCSVAAVKENRYLSGQIGRCRVFGWNGGISNTEGWGKDEPTMSQPWTKHGWIEG